MSERDREARAGARIATVAPSGLILGLLGTAFVVLRLTGEITWPWVWVLAPFWAPWALALVLFVVVLAVAATAAVVTTRK